MVLLLKSLLNLAYSAILVSSHTAHCAQKCRLCTLAHRFCISKNGGTGGGGCGYLQCAMSWKLLSFAVKGGMVCAGWANSHAGCLSKIRKNTHLVDCSFLAGKDVRF